MTKIAVGSSEGTQVGLRIGPRPVWGELRTLAAVGVARIRALLTRCGHKPASYSAAQQAPAAAIAVALTYSRRAKLLRRPTGRYRR